MLHSLPLYHRITGQSVVVVGDGDMADAKRRLIERAGGVPCAETQAHQAQLGFVALSDAHQAERAALRLKRLGLLVNVADRPDLCDFTLPSILERGPVLVAVSTGGASAGLAKHLRLRLEAILPQSLGALATKLAAAREQIRSRYPQADARRRAIDGALSENGLLDPLAPGSADRVNEWLGKGQVAQATAVFDFTLTSDDPDDLTLRQARELGRADAVIHDPAVPEAILIRARADAVRALLPHDPAMASGRVVILRRF